MVLMEQPVLKVPRVNKVLLVLQEVVVALHFSILLT
jgi:hypothetical protein